MITIAVCRDLYPSWKSTTKYLDSLDADIAILPEGVLSSRGKTEWDIGDIATHTASRSITLVGSHDYDLLVVRKGKVEYHGKNPPPLQFTTENGSVTGLVRICAMSLTLSPHYDIKSDLLMIPSSIAFSFEDIIRKHAHNLAINALVLMSTYELRNCWARKITGEKTGEETAKNRGGYIKANIGSR